jgi:hypothetical protein
VFPVGERSAPVFLECLLASPIAYEPAVGPTQVIQAGGGVVVGLSSETTELLWVVDLPAPTGQRAFVVGTPVIRGDRLAVGYQTRPTAEGGTLDPNSTGRDASAAREAHFVAIVDLAGERLDPDFETVELGASVPAGVGEGSVSFLPSNAFLRSEVAWEGVTADTLGYIYVTFGNTRDLQPWHGWVFELDMDAWRTSEDDAISAALCTTPEVDCGRTGASGSRQRICGGGLWAPSGTLAVELGDGRFELILAPGNGQLDLERNDYANTLMRVGPGLEFDPGCSAEMCADFDSDSPSEECMMSCENLFIPRSLPGEGPPRPESGICDGLSFFECWQELDYVGGSTPVFLELSNGLRVLAYPTKDGALYLVDYDHLGTLYDRHQLVDVCGTATSGCTKSWAGMIVSEPVLTEVDGEPLLIVPTFMDDDAHPAGLVAVRVVLEDGLPRLERAWEYPDFATPEAIEANREGTGRARLSVHENTEIAWVVETGAAGSSDVARLRGIRVSDGELAAAIDLVGPGYRFTQPLVVGDTIWVNSCTANNGPGTLEGYQIETTD